MKKVLILAAAIVMCASLASAQSGGHIGLYSDTPGYSDCFLVEALYVTNNIYVVHTLLPEANSSQFKVDHNWGAIVQAPDYGANVFLGDIYAGIAITYVGCKALPHLLATLPFVPIAATPACTAMFEVVEDPAISQIKVVDCASAPLEATGGKLWVNGNEIDCPCEVGTEESNWSKIKALYQ